MNCVILRNVFLYLLNKFNRYACAQRTAVGTFDSAELWWHTETHAVDRRFTTLLYSNVDVTNIYSDQLFLSRSSVLCNTWNLLYCTRSDFRSVIVTPAVYLHFTARLLRLRRSNSIKILSYEHNAPINFVFLK